MSSAVATTPTLVLSFAESDIDLLTAEHVYVTLKNGRNAITKKDSAITVRSKEITVPLSQIETLQLGEGMIKVQANWTYSGGLRACSMISRVYFSEQLLQRVVE